MAKRKEKKELILSLSDVVECMVKVWLDPNASEAKRNMIGKALELAKMLSHGGQNAAAEALLRSTAHRAGIDLLSFYR